MNSRLTIWGCMLLSLQISCTSNKANKELGEAPTSGPFSKVFTMQGNRVFEQAIGSFAVDIIDTMLLVYSPKSAEGIFSLYGKKSHKFIGKFGREGRGPGEFLIPVYSGQCRVDS